MRRHVQGIDHVVIVVNELAAAADTFRRMGFTVAPRGDHTLGSRNHCVMFGEDYIELLTSPPENPHPSRQHYTDFATAGDGLAAIALRTDNAKAAYSEMLWAGFAPTDPVDFSRPVRLSEGTREARFRITQLAPDQTPGGHVFLCEHFTRDVVWRPEYQSHRNGATALAAVAIVADDVAATARAYERMFDTRAQAIAEGLLVETGSAPVAVVTAPALARRLPGIGSSPRLAPKLGALFVRVADRSAAADALAAGGIQHARMPDGSLAVGPETAHGIALVLG
jgi:catechol 2,3-dioxygenase-like lactoylglutathione lyase family enzyme